MEQKTAPLLTISVYLHRNVCRDELKDPLQQVDFWNLWHSFVETTQRDAGAWTGEDYRDALVRENQKGFSDSLTICLHSHIGYHDHSGEYFASKQ